MSYHHLPQNNSNSFRDSFKADFILQAYLSDEKTLDENYRGPERTGKTALKSAAKPGASSSSLNRKAKERDFDMEASQIQDLFPHLGDGFIRKLLTRYDQSELAIAAIIEGNLPPDMQDMDQTEPHIPEDPRDAVFKETGVHRTNVFAGDALDVMTNDQLSCTVKYKGITVGAPRNVAELLNDKTHIKETRQRYEEYTMVPEGYDDEYDDSYDAMAESESKSRKSRSAGKEVVFDESSSEEEAEEEEAMSRAKNAFCENPEAIRARREQAWQAKFRRGGGGGVPKRDVVGTGVRGQGQSDTVQVNRQKKDQNKSSRANHNRRQGASWKRSRGMIPS